MMEPPKQGKEVFKGKLFAVKHIQKILPDGKQKTFELVDLQDAVTILAIDEDENVILVEQFRIGADKSMLELPAGKVESGEDPLAAARRELREETGLDAKEFIHLGNFYISPGYASEYMHCYLARGLFSAPLPPDADEFIEPLRIGLDQLTQSITQGKIEDSKTLAALALANARKK